MKLTEELTDFENYSEDLRTWGLMGELLLPTLPIHHFKEIDKLINETVKLEVGSFVILRDDLVSHTRYNDCLYVSSMAHTFDKENLVDEKIPYLRIKDYVNSVFQSRNFKTINRFVIYDQPSFMTYSYEMLQWEKTIILNYLVTKLKFCIEEAMYILDRVYENYISTREGKHINNTSNEEQYIDLELKNTSVLRLHDMVLNQNTLTSKVTDDMLNTSTIKTIRSNEEHDIEKAVMMTILKGLNINYSDILKCVELVQEKWVLSAHEKYYFLDDELDVVTTFYSHNSVNRNRIKVGNYFKTQEEAETKVEEIKEVLRGDYDGK